MGSLSDPDDLPGLAHFLEHMLFYSSEKYPVEDEYRYVCILCGAVKCSQAQMSCWVRCMDHLVACLSPSMKSCSINPTCSKFIAKHGGQTNAFTASESTNYHFDVNWDALAPALDRHGGGVSGALFLPQALSAI